MPSRTEDCCPFNLIDADWIPVLYRNGRPARVGIWRALTEAGRIRQIAASNPMDNVALLRFLIAVLLWCKPDVNDAARPQLDGAAGVPAEWLVKLEKHKAAFNLLGNRERFYQDADLMTKEPRPIADLLAEFPGADSVNHMRHVTHDGSYGFCPACCALGIMRLSVWAPANRFYPASVNPGSAAYAFLVESNLLQTLVINSPQSDGQVETAAWESDSPPAPPGAVAKLSWRPRRLWLNVGENAGVCANCGTNSTLVVSLCNEGGWPTPTTDGKTKKFWEGDPHLLKSEEPISLPGLGATMSAQASTFWRAALHARGPQPGRCIATGPSVNKFVFQDAVSIKLPPASSNTRAELTKACSDKLRGLLKRATPNPDRQHPEVVSAVIMLTPDAEAGIRSKLEHAVAVTDDVDFLHAVYRPLIEQAVASTARGSPLRRRAATSHALFLLKRKVMEAVEAQQAPKDNARQGDGLTKRTATKKGRK